MDSKKTDTISIPLFSERKKILILYILFFGTLVIGFITPPTAAALSLMACILILAGIYSFRAQAKKDSLTENHMTFLIRTFWRANLYLVYSTFLGVIYLLVMTDYSAFNPCVSFAMDRWTYVAMNWGPKEFSALFSQCTKPFMRDNTINLVIGIFMMIFPILIYLLNRFILGWKHATRGIPVTSSKL